jgi:hypothetical protein
MANPAPSNDPNPKKPYSKLKLLRDLLVLVALGWLGFQAYWGYFKLKIWMAGFGTGAFWTAGLIGGFIYFYAVHRIYERIKVWPQGVKKAMAYSVFCLGLLLLNPVPISLVLWIFVPPGSLSTIGHWFFIGSAVAGVIVLLLERIFSRKTPKTSRP